MAQMWVARWAEHWAVAWGDRKAEDWARNLAETMGARMAAPKVVWTVRNSAARSAALKAPQTADRSGTQ
jgi:hypothetical protein